MKKKQKSSVTKASMDEGFVSLIDGYMYALEDNSSMISAMLNELTQRSLSKDEVKTLKGIEKELKRIDKGINNLGE